MCVCVTAVRSITSAVPSSVPGIKGTTACQWTENHKDSFPVEKNACTVFRNHLFFTFLHFQN